ncbi:TetR/AcrR family transcriptional regulator [Nocardia anaemiae]|uniref:TetR/AcrR family transcriptional regulator n=1 Tax=Nocardia anaemiae TaxID=263910 RepID=UPI0007A50B00|nr:TetR/AcrR family transcriptional regulator [Nocardia anaemiae]
MTEIVATKRDRIARRQVDKFGERRAQLAAAALHTLAELGYARTSLREIAQKSEFTHGVLHYYFNDKVELITHAVRQYEQVCVTRYDDIVAAATTAEQLRHDFGAAMAATLDADAPLHRLWYDLRNQSLFEESFRADVLEIDGHREQMIRNVVDRFADLSDRPLLISSATAYAIFDGLFQQALLRKLAGDRGAAETLATEAAGLLDVLIGPGKP